MVLLTYLVLFVTFLHSVTADLNHTITKYGNKNCFLLLPENKVHLQFLNYTSLESFKNSPISVPFIFYRQKEVNTGRVFSGSTNINHICDAESIELGYCEEKHLGKILYEYKNPEESKGNVFSVILDEVNQTFTDFYQVNEAGLYCMLAKGFKAENFKIMVTEVNGYSRGSGQYQAFVAQIIDSALFLITFLSFTRKWVRWTSKSNSKLPYLIYLSQLTLMFDLVSHSAQVAETALVYHRMLQDGWLKDALHWVKSLSGDTGVCLRSFIIYQYSAEFTFDALEQYELVYLFELSYFFNIISSFLFYYTSNNEGGHGLWKIPSFIVSISGFVSFVMNSLLFSLYLQIKTWMRYRKSVKSYHDFNKTSDPRLHQFRWFILGTLNLRMVAVILGVLAALIEELIRSIPYLTETFLIDGSINLYSAYWTLFPPIFVCTALEYHILVNVMSPENYMKSLKYKISAD